MTTAVAERPTKENGATNRVEQLPAIAPPRLPYHPAIEQRFGIDKAAWKALVEAIFPGATSTESVILALSYCRARKLDPFKRVVHIVPIWDKNQGRMVDTVWPGIGELRTTAFRTGEYAGREPSVFGPDVTKTIGKVELTFPEWGQVTVYRIVKGQRVPFAGPRVYWQETYATRSRSDESPNEMWASRPRGQLDKCCEAAALRAAFPEEIGSDYIPEEVSHLAPKTVDGTAVQSPQNMDALADRLLGANGEVKNEPDHPAETVDAGDRPQTGDTVDQSLLDELTTALKDAEGFSDFTAIGATFSKRATDEATRTAIAAACESRATEIRNSRGERSNK